MSPYNAFNRPDPSADTLRIRKIVFPRVFRAFSRVFGPGANRKIALQPKIGLQIVLVGLLAVTGTGCASKSEIESQKLKYKADRSDYYDQVRFRKVVKWKMGPNAVLNLSGPVEFEIYAPIEPLGQPQMPPSAWTAGWNALKDIARSVATAWAGIEIVGALREPVQPVTLPTQIIQQPVPFTP